MQVNIKASKLESEERVTLGSKCFGKLQFHLFWFAQLVKHIL
jgi:hypothetical protein